MATTLFQFYQQRGEKLPPLSERAKIYEQKGLGTAADYISKNRAGNPAPNIALLASFQQQAPPGDISGKLGGPTPAAPTVPAAGSPSVTGGLGNFRVALKAALNEAAQARSADRMTQVYPELGGVPGTMGDIAKMIRGSVAPPVEDVFTTILEARTEQQKQSMDLLETLARDGTLASLPDNVLNTLGKNAGLNEGIVTAWKSRIATAVEQDERMARFEIAKIQSEIEENRAQAEKARGAGSEDDYAPTPVTLSYVDEVTNNPDFGLANVPGEDERNRVAKFIYERDIKNEATSLEGIADKLDSLDSTQQTAKLTDEELRMWFLNQKENLNEDYQSVLTSIVDLPITNKEVARFIAGEIYGVLPYTPMPEGEVGALLPEGPKEKRKSLLFPEDWVYTPPDFSSFPSIFNF